ncbi:hypothetical protein COO60DRAFT_831366 [Scenedesmus sp. NREL 46B-D3]|nr:hypothetical protein COO60DRAFT_831366 [Scenedesmus sp. NREL 46B-D3]
MTSCFLHSGAATCISRVSAVSVCLLGSDTDTARGLSSRLLLCCICMSVALWQAARGVSCLDEAACPILMRQLQLVAAACACNWTDTCACTRTCPVQDSTGCLTRLQVCRSLCIRFSKLMITSVFCNSHCASGGVATDVNVHLVYNAQHIFPLYSRLVQTINNLLVVVL